MGRILFSPIGSTDPISGYHDGALLHITRVYRPDMIFLYYSKEIIELEEKDHRYTYCLDKLFEKENLECKRIDIIDRAMTEVHIFDNFIEYFRTELTKINSDYPDEEIYVNVSSGTPAMKSALQVLSCFSEFRIIPVQVGTPVKKINKREELHNYDVELQWEYNEDNSEEFENRCRVSSNTNMLVEIKKEIICKHIEVYDYVAALQIADTMKAFVSPDVGHLLRAGIARLKLDRAEVTKELKGLPYDVIPAKSSNEITIFEYILVLQVKLAKEEYGDFIRAITPIFFKLLEKILIDKCNYDIGEYCRKQNGRRKWDENKTSKDELLMSIYDIPLSGDIKTDNLVRILERICGDAQIYSTAKELRAIEEQIRNTAAHEIKSVTKKEIINITGASPEEILKKVKKLVRYSGMNVDKEEWESYTQLNDQIVKALRIIQ